ncbi:hypothetical protein TRIUR3_19525 [Triticum urartu]|uniref:Uncharacterized protein n=1 Tax=Triticum urartu TaxID=4572 RepID=M8B3I3_TRIUA|nr:hypothetical protein TRIUR3_19525 [Triticum urartu]
MVPERRSTSPMSGKDALLATLLWNKDRLDGGGGEWSCKPSAGDNFYGREEVLCIGAAMDALVEQGRCAGWRGAALTRRRRSWEIRNQARCQVGKKTELTTVAHCAVSAAAVVVVVWRRSGRRCEVA